MTTNIFELPKHDKAIDLSKVTTIQWRETIPAQKVPRWILFLSFGRNRSIPEQKPYIKICPDNHYAVNYEYDTDKETEKIYKALIKAWKGK